MSGKVKELFKILEQEEKEKRNLKAIIFVKDRSVATYLKKIMDYHVKKENLLSDEFSEFSMTDISDRTAKFRCGYAIGF